MGTSTDAYLVWGIQVEEGWGQDVEEPEDEETPTVAHKLVFCGGPADGVRAVAHCSNEHSMFILTDREYPCAWRGYPKAVAPAALTDGNADALRAFAAKHDIPLTGEAAWWLCSMWS
jgi:hypothetical protein